MVSMPSRSPGVLLPSPYAVRPPFPRTACGETGAVCCFGQGSTQIRPPVRRVTGPNFCLAVWRPAAKATPTTVAPAPATTALRCLTAVHIVSAPEVTLPPTDAAARLPLSTPAVAARLTCWVAVEMGLVAEAAVASCASEADAFAASAAWALPCFARPAAAVVFL